MNVERCRGGLAFKAHRLCVSLNYRLERNREEERRENLGSWCGGRRERDKRLQALRARERQEVTSPSSERVTTGYEPQSRERGERERERGERESEARERVRRERESEARERDNRLRALRAREKERCRHTLGV